MPSNARLLQFPDRRVALSRLSIEEARECASRHLATREKDANGGLFEFFENADFLAALCSLLRDVRDSSPQLVADESVSAYGRISEMTSLGLFDEKDYFLGEFAYLASGAFRLMGSRGHAVEWLGIAETRFRHTIDSAASLANVAYVRLALAFDCGEYETVLRGVASLEESFVRLGLQREVAKCVLLHAVVLKQEGQFEAALSRLVKAAEGLDSSSDARLLSRVMVEMADNHQLRDEPRQAISCFSKAASLLPRDEVSMFSADLKMFLGAAYWGQKEFPAALQALRAAQGEYQSLGMATRSAYVRLFVADTLLRVNRPREAEWEILAALPTIEGEGMATEASTAVSLLGESVRQRKTNSGALSEVLKHLETRR